MFSLHWTPKAYEWEIKFSYWKTNCKSLRLSSANMASTAASVNLTDNANNFCRLAWSVYKNGKVLISDVALTTAQKNRPNVSSLGFGSRSCKTYCSKVKLAAHCSGRLEFRIKFLMLIELFSRVIPGCIIRSSSKIWGQRSTSGSASARFAPVARQNTTSSFRRSREKVCRRSLVHWATFVAYSSQSLSSSDTYDRSASISPG